MCSMPVPVPSASPLPPPYQSEPMSFSFPERSEASRPNSIPLFGGSHSMFLSPAQEQDELQLQSAPHEEEQSIAPSEPHVPALDPSIKLWEDGSLQPSGSTQSTVEAQTPLMEKTTKKVNIKCLGHPFNGHTFSVSPNQVVNISAGKFSVRHLVNEFELHSSRSSMSSLGGGASESNNNNNSSNPSAIIFEGEQMKFDSKSWSKRESESSGSENNMLNDGAASNNSSNCNSDSNQSDGEKDEITVNEVTTTTVECTEDQVESQEPPNLVPVVEKVVSEQRKKPEKFAWAPFFRRNSSSTTKEIHIPSNGSSSGTVSAPSGTKSSIGNLFTGWHSNKKVGEAPNEAKGKGKGKKHAEISSRAEIAAKDEVAAQNSKVLESFRCSGATTEDSGAIENPIPTAAKVDEDAENDCTLPTGNIHSAAYQSTGVVKQRLEAFEAKKVPSSDPVVVPSIPCSSGLQPSTKSHIRSHSAVLSSAMQPIIVPCNANVAGTTSTASDGEECSMSSTHGHQRKSSMPVLSCSNPDSGSVSEIESNATSAPSFNTAIAVPNIGGPHLRLPSTFLTPRKGSLDSNTLFKTLPKTRNFTVRGFQPPGSYSGSSSLVSSGPKSLFSSGTVKVVRPPTSGTSGSSDTSSSGSSSSSNCVDNVSCESSPPVTFAIRQEHGSTHPLKFLPKTSKCT